MSGRNHTKATRTHKHVNRLPNALTADCLLSLRGQANVRTRREEQAPTVLKVASAQKEREDERRGQTSDALRLNMLICLFPKLSQSASVPWLSDISAFQSIRQTLFTYVNTRRYHPSLSPSRVGPLVLLAWCLMEPVPHTGPLRDYAGANHRFCDSSISLQLALTWGGGVLRPCWKPAAKVADGAGGSKTHVPELFLRVCRSNCSVYWGFHSIKLLHYKQSDVENS